MNPAVRLRRFYTLALGTIALLVVGQHVLLSHRLNDARGLADLVNRSGRQRMLSQRIAKDAARLATPLPPESRASVVRELEASLSRWSRAHSALLHARTQRELGIPTEVWTDVSRHFADIQTAGLNLVASGGQGEHVKADAAAILSREDQFLRSMESAVSGLQRYAERRVDELQRLELLLALLALGVLGLEAAFIFRPAERTIAQQFAALRRRVKEAHEARRTADAAAQARGDFLASMSHEIRTPLNGVIGMATLLGDSDLRPEQREQLGTLLTSAQCLLTLLNDVLDYSKFEAGHVDLERVPFELTDLVEDVAAAFGPTALAKGVEVVCEIAPEVPEEVYGDPTRLRQVLSNLVGNAVKFTERGSVTVCAEYARAVLTLTIQDSGIGMSPETIAGLFQKFTQADRTIARRYGGTGLGLAIVKQLVDAQGGRVEVESTLGRGSVFRVLLPLEAIRKAKTAPVRLDGQTILCVDDNEVNLRVIASYIASIGGHPVTVRTAARAQQMVRQEPDRFHLAVLDMDLDDGDGLLLARQIRRHSAMPLILASSVVLDGTAEERARFASILLKPLRRQSLQSAILAAFSPPEKAEPAPEPCETPRPLRLLVVEDNPVNQLVVKGFLDRTRDAYVFAATGAEATAHWESERFDAVLMDVSLPDADGIELTRTWRESRLPQARIPIIGLTASSGPEERARCLEAGMDAFIPKPLDRSLLRHELDSLRARLRPILQSSERPTLDKIPV